MIGEVKRIATSNCVLGEGPLWLSQSSELIFVDIIGKRLLKWHHTHGLSEIDLDQRVGCVVQTSGKHLMCASERGIFELNSSTGGLKSVGHDKIISQNHLMNDGKCDRQGRFVFGSKAVNEIDKTGRLMSFDGIDMQFWQSGTVMNGPAFNPDGTRIYFADSPARTVFSAPYDSATGTVGEAETFVVLDEDAGYPDGMSVDAQGYLWNAHWDGWRISRYRPDGELDLVIKMPVAKPTSIAFGGINMTTLFITSAQTGRAEDPIVPAEMAGDLFAIETDIVGLAEPKFTGISDA